MRVLVDAEGTPVGRFDRMRAEEIYDATDVNGSGRILLRTAGGRYVVAEVSQWANIPATYVVDEGAVIEFCASYNINLPAGAGTGLTDFDKGGRPEIGPAFSLRFQPDLLTAVDAAAEGEGITRAEWVRRAALRALGLTGRALAGGEVPTSPKS